MTQELEQHGGIDAKVFPTPEMANCRSDVEAAVSQ